MVSDSLLTDESANKGSERENRSAPPSYSEIFLAKFPYYLSIGMTEEQYWDRDSTLVKSYRKAEELRKERVNQEMWLQGMYIYDAISRLSPILRAFAKKGTKAQPYVPSDGKTLYRVQTGAFSKRSNADAWAAKLKAAGFDTYIVQMGNLYKVQVGAYSQKSNAENMMAKLKAAGYDAFITTKSGTAAGIAKKSAAEIAKEIYNGTCSDARWSSWGNGTDRVNRLKQAGYDPSEVQSEVNKLF